MEDDLVNMLERMDVSDLKTSCETDERTNKICNINPELNRKVYFYYLTGKDIKETTPEFRSKLLFEKIYQNNIEEVYWLLENIYYSQKDKNEALLLSGEFGNYDIFQLLLSRGGDLNYKNCEIINFVSFRGNIDIMYFLLKGPINTACKNKALVTAAGNNKLEIVKLLLDNHANLHFDSDKPLIESVRSGDYDIAKYLLKRGADASAQDNLPIILASMEDYVEIFDLLISYGADPHANNDEPLNTAYQSNSIKILNYLTKLSPRRF